MKLKDLIQIERKIAIGMIISTEFLTKINDILDMEWIQSTDARILMTLCNKFFLRYEKAPGKNIETLFYKRVQKGKIPEKNAEIIEEILESLSEEYTREDFNVDYIFDQAVEYCKACKMKGYTETIQDLIDDGNILEGEQLLCKYKPVEKLQSNAVTPLGTVEQIKKAHENYQNPLFSLPGSIGNLMNIALVRQGFVALMGQNKGGKSFLLMYMALMASKQGKNVVFFQAGDMSQEQMERRFAIYFAKKSDIPKYCKELYYPAKDCIYNLNGDCEREIYENPEQDAPFDGEIIDKIQDKSFTDMVGAFEEFPNHKRCYNCLRRSGKSYFKGSVWFKRRAEVKPLTWKDTYHLTKKKYKHLIKRIKLITYSSESLTTQKLNAELDILEKQNFIADVVIGDYLDVFAPDIDTVQLQTRDQENKRWQRIRKMTQDRNCLGIFATQSDSQGFKKLFLDKTNFSEDRRKLDHVTAMFGLNMTIEEKKKGIMRINDIVSRDAAGTGYVHVLHRLEMGRPIIGSYF